MHQFHATFIILFSDTKDVAKDIFEDVTDDIWKEHGSNDLFAVIIDNAQTKH